MARNRLKARSADVQEAIQLALESGSMPLQEACKAIRIVKGMSQQEFADAIGVALNVVKEIESGKSNPKLSSLEKYANAAGLRVVFALPKSNVKLGDFAERAGEKQRSRERDFDKVSDGAKPADISAVNAMSLPEFSYELPRL